jgi:hypothetical protein
MANVKISALPSYTGSAADLRWFVMNNSGETETYKYSGYSSQLIPGQGGGSYITPGNTTGANSLAIGDNNIAGGGQSFMFGYSNTDQFNNRIIGIGAGNNIGSAWSVGLGYSNTLVGSNFSTESVLIGYGNTINGTGVGTGNINIGQSQTISDGSYNTILNGKSNALQGGLYNNILNGSGNTISSSYSGVSMLSCFGRTANASNTTYVENIHSYRTPSTEVQPVSSGTTFTCNLDNGAKSQFYLTGVSTVDITNVRDGQSFLIKTQTDGGHNITWTSTGYTFKWKGGSSNPGNNKIDLFRFEVFGSVIYGELISDFS